MRGFYPRPWFSSPSNLFLANLSKRSCHPRSYSSHQPGRPRFSSLVIPTSPQSPLAGPIKPVSKPYLGSPWLPPVSLPPRPSLTCTTVPEWLPPPGDHSPQGPGTRSHHSFAEHFPRVPPTLRTRVRLHAYACDVHKVLSTLFPVSGDSSCPTSCPSGAQARHIIAFLPCHAALLPGRCPPFLGILSCLSPWASVNPPLPQKCLPWVLYLQNAPRPISSSAPCFFPS